MKRNERIRRAVARLLTLCEQLAAAKRALDRATRAERKKRREAVQ